MLNFANSSRSEIFTEHLDMTAFIPKNYFVVLHQNFWGSQANLKSLTGTLKNSEFTGKHLQWCSTLSKSAGSGLKLYEQQLNLMTGVFGIVFFKENLRTIAPNIIILGFYVNRNGYVEMLIIYRI